MSHITTHLKTIDDIDGTGYRRGRERTQALEAIAEEVADALLTGRPVPVYKDIEGFFHIKGFAEAVAKAIVAQSKTTVDQRYALAKYVEEKGVEHGREAARLLREMNAQSAVLPWETLEPQPAGGPFDSVARNDRPVDEVDTYSEGLRRELLLRMKVRLVPETDVSIISDREGTETITLVSGVDEDEDEAQEYDVISQSDISAGDIVEYRDGENVARWEVVSRELKLSERAYEVQLQALGPINAIETVRLPLPFDPKILRPRS